MRKIKINLIILLVVVVILWMGSKKTALALCACKTKNDGVRDEGVKSCEVTYDACADGKTATCKYDLSGGCNILLPCYCLAEGEEIPGTGEGRYGFFCTQEGFGPASDEPKINTALGCVPVQMDKFVLWLLPKLFGVAGGIAFLLMVYGFIILGTSSGDPKKVQGAQETITSAITGLLLSLFALFILRLIAVDILQIPGF